MTTEDFRALEIETAAQRKRESVARLEILRVLNSIRANERNGVMAAVQSIVNADLHAPGVIYAVLTVQAQDEGDAE